MTVKLPLSAVVLALAICAGSCAGSRTAAPPAARDSRAELGGSGVGTSAGGATASPARTDGDADGDGRGRFDHDDTAVLHAGRRARPGETRAIAALFERYYAAAAAGKGARACALTVRALAAAIPTDEGSPHYGPNFLRGLKTCPAIMSRLFAYTHGEVSAPIKIVAIRIAEDHAFVVLGSRTMPMSLMEATRDQAGWRVDRFRSVVLP